MKAALFYGGNDIRLKTVPIPEPERGHVQVRVQATGICGGDISGYKACLLYTSPSPRDS